MYGRPQNQKFSKYNELYLSVAHWAGLSVGAGPSFDIAPFMHPGPSAQPTANDSFFAFFKAGLVLLVHGVVHHVHKDSVLVKYMQEEGESNSNSKSISLEIPCEVFLKCVGWKDPGNIVQKIYPQFESQNFVFLNKSPRVAYICDPRYQHKKRQIWSDEMPVLVVVQKISLVTWSISKNYSYRTV